MFWKKRESKYNRNVGFGITSASIVVLISYIIYSLELITRSRILCFLVICLLFLIPLSIIRSYFGVQLMILRKRDKSKTIVAVDNYLKLTFMAMVVVLIATIVLLALWIVRTIHQ